MLRKTLISAVVASGLISLFSSAYAIVIEEPNNIQSLQQQIKYQRNVIKSDINTLVRLKVQEAMLQKKLNARNGFKWIPVKKTLPNNVVRVSESKNADVICKAPYAGNEYPGYLKGFPNKTACVLTFAGRAVTIKQTQNIKILTSKVKPLWIDGSQLPAEPSMNTGYISFSPHGYRYEGMNRVPITSMLATNKHQAKKIDKRTPGSKPVLGGYENGHYLFICRVKIAGKWQIGKVVSKNCDFDMNNKEGTLPTFQAMYDQGILKKVKK